MIANNEDFLKHLRQEHELKRTLEAQQQQQQLQQQQQHQQQHFL